MTIPVYVVTGFLGAGKTTFLNQLFDKEEWQNIKVLLLQFEEGEEEAAPVIPGCVHLPLADELQQPGAIPQKIAQALARQPFDEIWVEWNGMQPFSLLQTIFYNEVLATQCSMKRVMQLAEVAQVPGLIGNTGAALPQQIANSDFVVLRGSNDADSGQYRKAKQLLRGLNPGVPLVKNEDLNGVYRNFFSKKIPPLAPLAAGLASLLALLAAFWLIPQAKDTSLASVLTIFMGIMLQAIPFLTIGVLLSSAIQVFVPARWIEEKFPKSLGLGVLFAVLAGFLLPVCDCTSIPVFRSIVKKGVPLPVAITFVTVTPVINPVVILSTYYAFGGDLSVVLARVCFGIITSILVCIAFILWPTKGEILSGGAVDRMMCSCGYYEPQSVSAGAAEKWRLFLRHSQAEFFSVGKYLVLGTLLASVIQVVGGGIFFNAPSGLGLAVSTVLLMGMAFVLSLCSSSDAVIGRSLANQFPMGAIMGFLVFGPMMDIKNVMMLSSGFSKRFIVKLTAITFTASFLVVFLFSSLGAI